MILPAISIMQPWPYAIFHLDKDVENRSWRLPSQYDGVPVLIHAGKRRDRYGDIYLRGELGSDFPFPTDLPLGGIVGFAVFRMLGGSRIGPIETQSHRWSAIDKWNWHILASGELPFHPCKGQLGFFKVDYPHEVPVWK